MSDHNSSLLAADAHRRNLQLQAEQHPLVEDSTFASLEGYILHLIHLKAYEEAAGLAAGKAVLDLGCNVGYGMQVMLSTASSVAGIDLSPQSVEAARKRLGPAADVRLYDGVRSDFSPQSFDVVTNFQVIEHVSDYEAYFSEILRLLRPGGMLLLTTPNATLRLDPGMKPWYEFHVREFTAEELRDLLTPWFEAVEVRGLFGREELYRIEYNRLERAKRAARASRARLRQTLKNLVKSTLPWMVPVSHKLRAWITGEQANKGFDQSQAERFSTQDLFYRTDNLEEALDLMAICHAPPASKTKTS